MRHKLTGRLEGWEKDKRFTDEDGETVLWGFIYDDVHNRFPDGTWIHTSGCKNVEYYEGNVVTTRNSRYLLGEPWKEGEEDGLIIEEEDKSC